MSFASATVSPTIPAAISHSCRKISAFSSAIADFAFGRNIAADGITDSGDHRLGLSIVKASFLERFDGFVGVEC